MGFQTNDPELTNTIFSQDDLINARLIWMEMIRDLDPSWGDDPKGPLALHWKSDGQYPATYLIHMALLFVHLRRNVTKRSLGILEEKWQLLLRPPSKPGAFEQLLVEMEAVASFAERVSPISLEPLSSAEQTDRAIKTRSPDFGLRLPDGDVCIEVTNVYFKYLEDWDTASRGLTEALSRRILKNGIRRDVSVLTPVSANRADMMSLLEKCWPQILRDESGHFEGDRIHGRRGRVTWSLPPHFATDENGMPVISGPSFCNSGSASSGGSPPPLAGVSWHPLVDGMNIEEVTLRSIRNSLKAKRAQMTAAMPYILVIRIGHHRINPQAVMHLIEERIFPNPVHAWLTGIAIFTPRQNWEKDAVATTIDVLLNEAARFPAPHDLRSLLAGSDQFHL